MTESESARRELLELYEDPLRANMSETTLLDSLGYDVESRGE